VRAGAERSSVELEKSKEREQGENTYRTINEKKGLRQSKSSEN
jgi:hypothetical protein